MTAPRLDLTLRFGIDVLNTVLVAWPRADLLQRVALYQSAVRQLDDTVRALAAGLGGQLPEHCPDLSAVQIDRFTAAVSDAPVAVRLTHGPSGLVVTAEDQGEALAELAERLLAHDAARAAPRPAPPRRPAAAAQDAVRSGGNSPSPPGSGSAATPATPTPQP